MPFFAYTATNDDGKEVKGSLDAPDGASARRSLKDLHLDVKQLQEATRGGVAEPTHIEPPKLKTTFVFEGRDSANIERKGTIQADGKYEAFEKLKREHDLTLTLLTPMGVRPLPHDFELDRWQPAKSNPTVAVVSKPATSAAQPTAAVTTQPAPKSLTFGFTEAPVMKQAAVTSPTSQEHSSILQYLPLVSTLRLYAGWLLAWYGLFVGLGYYATVRSLPLDIPFVMSFYASPLIFTITVAVFLFLLFTEIQRVIHGKLISGVVLTVSGFAVFIIVNLSL